MRETGKERRLEPARLLSFYDDLRARIVRYVSRRSRKLAPAAVEALLLVPDVFVLLLRLTLDPKVPTPARSLVGGALLYFVSPVDLFPEGFLGPVGYLEDLVLAAAVLAQALGGELEPFAKKYWSGEQELREVVHDIAHSAHSLLGARLYRRLERALARRGLRLGGATETSEEIWEAEASHYAVVSARTAAKRLPARREIDELPPGPRPDFAPGDDDDFEP